ncbi:MAG: esterase/lipase family protein [Nocardioidaceae bacterium]
MSEPSEPADERQVAAVAVPLLQGSAAQGARLTDAAALVVDYADSLIVGTVRDVHQRIARRVFTPTRALVGRMPERIHDAVAATAYAGLSTTATASATALRALSRHGVGRRTEATPAGRRLISGVNGLVGADLLERDDPAAITMAVRREHADVGLDAASLAAAYPMATGSVVVFLHGLGENDESWRLRADQPHGTYDDAVRRVGWTPVQVRYNTGRHVSDNGADLSALITDLVGSWPVEARRIAFVGHSMGGLVARAATNHAVATEAGWTASVTHVVCLGTPHLGAALEKVVHLGARAFTLLPEAAPFGRILDVRSPGIVDLRHGYVSQAEWQDQDLTATWGRTRLAVASLPHADYHFVAATLGSSPRHVAARLFGDLLVRYPSAVGHGLRGEPVVAQAIVDYLPATDHFALLNHPTVAGWLATWLAPPSPPDRSPTL